MPRLILALVLLLAALAPATGIEVLVRVGFKCRKIAQG